MLAPMEFSSSVPAELRDSLERWWERACGQEAFLAQYRALADRQREELPRVIAASEFVAQALIQDPGAFEWLGMHSDHAALAGTEYERRAAASESGEQALSVLREWRRRAMVRIAWRDIAATASVTETLLAV